MRHGRRAEHQAQHQRQEVAPLGIERATLLRITCGVATGERQGLRRQAGQRLSADLCNVALALVAQSRLIFANWQGALLAFDVKDACRWRAGLAQLLQLQRQLRGVGGHGCGHVGQLGLGALRPLAQQLDDLLLGWIVSNLAFAFGQLRQRCAIGGQRQGLPRDLDRQPHHG